MLATDINAGTLAELPRPGARDRARSTCSTATRSSRCATGVGAVDVLFNCAGFVEHGTILDTDEENWAFSFDLNVTAMYRMIRAFLPAMLAQGGGSIVNIASVASSIIARAEPLRLRRDQGGGDRPDQVGRRRLRHPGHPLQLHLPGHVESPSLHERMRAQGDYEAARAAFVARQPMGRLGRPEEIAALAVYLASDESAFTTGVAHVIDGGWTNI